MAIPFYEDEPVATASAATHSQFPDGDQVDGPAVFESYDQVDYEAPPTVTPNQTATPTTGSTASSAPSTEEQLLAWKLLALTMCKVLRQFYLQQKQQPSSSSSSPSGSKSSKLTATVQIQPQAQ